MSESITIALIGIAGAVVGSLATMAANVLLFNLKQAAEARRDEPRRELLREMLKSPKHTWRKLETLMHVIGADEEKTKDLLLQIGARASEDGQNKWALKSREPLPM